MKLEVGQFARLKSGYIVKILNVKDYWIETDTRFITRTFPQDFAKASYNIIDILEVGDYVNGSEVLDFENKYTEEDDKFVPIGVITENCYLENTDSWIIEKNIKTVITHEQFEQMAYKVGE